MTGGHVSTGHSRTFSRARCRFGKHGIWWASWQAIHRHRLVRRCLAGLSRGLPSGYSLRTCTTCSTSRRPRASPSHTRGPLLPRRARNLPVDRPSVMPGRLCDALPAAISKILNQRQSPARFEGPMAGSPSERPRRCARPQRWAQRTTQTFSDLCAALTPP